MKFSIRLPMNPIYINLLNKQDNLVFLTKVLADHYRFTFEHKLELEPKEWEQEMLTDFARLVSDTGQGETLMECLFNVYNDDKRLVNLESRKDIYEFTFQ